VAKIGPVYLRDCATLEPEFTSFMGNNQAGFFKLVFLSDIKFGIPEEHAVTRL
jgi:hypothetical protein